MTDRSYYVEHPVALGADAVGVVVSPGRIQFHWRVAGEWMREMSEAETASLMAGKAPFASTPPMQDYERKAWARLVRATAAECDAKAVASVGLGGLVRDAFKEARAARQALRNLVADLDALLEEA